MNLFWWTLGREGGGGDTGWLQFKDSSLPSPAMALSPAQMLVDMSFCSCKSCDQASKEEGRQGGTGAGLDWAGGEEEGGFPESFLCVPADGELRRVRGQIYMHCPHAAAPRAHNGLRSIEVWAPRTAPSHTFCFTDARTWLQHKHNSLRAFKSWTLNRLELKNDFIHFGPVWHIGFMVICEKVRLKARWYTV